MFESLTLRIATLTSRYVVSPILLVKSTVTRLVQQMIPTHIQEIVHIDDRNWQVEALRKSVMRLDNKYESGYYYIKLWDGLDGTTKQYFMHAKHMATALTLRRMNSLWAFQDYGIALLLRSFMTFTKGVSQGIFTIIDPFGNDITNAIHGIINSLEMEQNITSQALFHFLRHKNIIPVADNIEAQDIKFTVVDYDLKETVIESDQYIIS